MALPEGFVYVKDIDPTIQESMRYAENHNFLGTVVTGYKKPHAILTRPAAIALSKVQQDLLAEGFSLVVYDAYRPQKAVNHFWDWSLDVQDQRMRQQYYPRVPKEKAFELGYIAKRSQHTRGSAVDLTIIACGHALNNRIGETPRKLTDGFDVTFLDDGTVDMGTSFDLFDDASHHDCSLITPAHLANRNYLRQKMKKYGFEEYRKEWWHFSLANEPFPETYFDFDVA